MSNLLSDLSVAIYKEPLCSFRNTAAFRDPGNPLAVVMLLIDYETGCSMNGIVTLLGNSTGTRMPETSAALSLIGCDSHAKALAEVCEIARESSMTYDAIQRDRASVENFAVTSFSSLHGDKWNDAIARIRLIHDAFDFDELWAKLGAYVEKHEPELRSRLSS